MNSLLVAWPIFNSLQKIGTNLSFYEWQHNTKLQMTDREIIYTGDGDNYLSGLNEKNFIIWTDPVGQMLSWPFDASMHRLYFLTLN